MAMPKKAPQAVHTPHAKFFVFEYLYRDASNYKAWGEILLSGVATDAEIAALRDCLEAGEYFVAEQVGIPGVYEELWALSGGPTKDDHALHEFVGMRIASEEERQSMPLFGTWSDLLWRFKAVIAWNYALSPNCSLA